MARALPRRWSHRFPSVRAEFDVRVTARSRLFAKVLVFETNRELCRFWRDGLGKGRLGSRTLGAVNGMICERVDCRGGREVRRRPLVDPRYFCVMGFVRSALCMEVIAHESVHAAFAYASRARWGSPWRGYADEMPEELVCYPAGAIAREIHAKCAELALYEEGRREG